MPQSAVISPRCSGAFLWLDHRGEITAEENPLAETIVALTGAKPRKVWTPTEAFLKRLTAARLEAIHTEIMGEVSEGFAKMKKGEKAARLHRVFAGADGIPPLSAEQKARVAAWLPEAGRSRGSDRGRSLPAETAPETAANLSRDDQPSGPASASGRS